MDCPSFLYNNLSWISYSGGCLLFLFWKHPSIVINISWVRRPFNLLCKPIQLSSFLCYKYMSYLSARSFTLSSFSSVFNLFLSLFRRASHQSPIPIHRIAVDCNVLVIPQDKFTISFLKTGGDNSNKRCLSGSVCKIKSSRKFERPSRIFQWHSRENFSKVR